MLIMNNSRETLHMLPQSKLAILIVRCQMKRRKAVKDKGVVKRGRIGESVIVKRCYI